MRHQGFLAEPLGVEVREEAGKVAEVPVEVVTVGGGAVAVGMVVVWKAVWGTEDLQVGRWGLQMAPWVVTRVEDMLEAQRVLGCLARVAAGAEVVVVRVGGAEVMVKMVVHMGLVRGPVECVWG